MSAPSLNSLNTVYGSCLGSDADSILSYQTFRSVRSGSVRSGSTNFYSDESDTDTLVNDEDATSEQFFDVEDELEEAAGGTAMDLEVEHAAADADDDNQVYLAQFDQTFETELMPSLTDFEPQSPSPVSERPTSSESPLLEERDRLLAGESSEPSDSSQNSLIQSGTASSPQRLFNYQEVITQIPSRSPRHTSRTSKSSSRLKGSHVPLYLLFVFVWTLGFHTALRFNSGLNSWLLTFWRSIFQLIVCLTFLIFARQSPFGSQGNRLKLVLHAVFSTVSVFSMLFSSERLHAGDLAAIYLSVPIGALVFEHALKRGSMRGHVSLFVILLWMAAILLMSRNTPWVDVPASLSNGTSSSNQTTFSNETSLFDELWPSNETSFSDASQFFDESNETSISPDISLNDELTLLNETTLSNKTSASNATDGTKWQPPIFGLDNIHLWPIQPSMYSEQANNIEYQENFFDQSQRVAGLVVGIVGLVSSSLLPGITASCPTDIIWPIMTWQAIGAFATSLTGVVLHNQTFLFTSVKDWLFATLITVLGFVGNFAMLKFLTMKQDDGEGRNGWTHSGRTIPVITVGVLARSALEIVVIYGINHSAFNDQAVLFEDGLGMGFLIGIGLFCCFIKPVEHFYQPKDYGANQ